MTQNFIKSNESLKIGKRKVELYKNAGHDSSTHIRKIDIEKEINGFINSFENDDFLLVSSVSYYLIKENESYFSAIKNSLIPSKRDLQKSLLKLEFAILSQEAKNDVIRSVRSFNRRFGFFILSTITSLALPFFAFSVAPYFPTLSIANLFMRASTITLASSIILEILISKYSIGENIHLAVNQVTFYNLNLKHKIAHILNITVVFYATLMTGFGDIVFRYFFNNMPKLILT